VTHLRIIASPRGVHMAVAIRSGETHTGDLALCGNMTLRKRDWDVLKYAIETGALQLHGDRIEVVDAKVDA
jgi:hypothetical protein